MHTKKPVPVAADTVRRICPVCNQRSYSVGGVHPQCAERQADAPRAEQERVEKKQAVKASVNPAARWKKRCPKCGVEIHIRNKSCHCGHLFTR